MRISLLMYLGATTVALLIVISAVVAFLHRTHATATKDDDAARRPEPAPSASATENKSGYRELFESSPDGILLANAEGRYTDVNAAGCVMLGYTRDEIVGHDITSLLSPDLVTERADVRRHLRQGGTRTAEWWMLRKDGRYLPVSATTMILSDGRWQAFIRDVSETRHHINELSETSERILDLYNNAPCGYQSLNTDGLVVQMNDTELRWLGYAPDEVVGKLVFADLLTADSRAAFQECFARFKEIGDVRDLELDLMRKDNTTFPVLMSSVALRDPAGKVVMCRSTLIDYSDRRRVDERLRQAATVFASTNEAILITDPAARIIAVNGAFETMTGFAAGEVLGENPRRLQSEREDGPSFERMWAELLRDGQWQGELWNRRKGGDEYPVWESISAVKDRQGRVTHYVSMLSDISAIKQSEARLTHQAHHDPLTGLPNRLLFTESLQKSLDRATRHNQRVALLFLDLDRFKLINDTLGHAAGDALLREMGSRLQHSVRNEDLVSRLGGDEFTVVLEDVEAAGDAAHVAEKIIAVINRPVLLDGKEVVTSASIGISLFPDDADDAAELAMAADAAMYRAKERGRQTYEFFTEDLTARTAEHLALEHQLRQALVRDEFRLYYQPQFDAASGGIVGLEALLRWRHPERGVMLPGNFIPVAEESALIEAIGDWVIGEACAQASVWREQGLLPGRLAINLSGRQILHDRVVQTLRDRVREHDLSARDLRIELEITETVLQTIDRSAEVLRCLRAEGARIAIDDFGTGYSSLNHLKHLPVDTLKIDQLFTRNVPADADNVAITSAIISLGHALGLRVIAEGVETESQLAFLRECGCDEVQGHLFSEAEPVEAITRVLRERAVPRPRPVADALQP